MLTIVRLQLNLKSYINENDDSNKDADDSTCNTKDRKMSFHYYYHQISTTEGPDLTLSLSNLDLMQEFFTKESKVS